MRERSRQLGCPLLLESPATRALNNSPLQLLRMRVGKGHIATHGDQLPVSTAEGLAQGHHNCPRVTILNNKDALVLVAMETTVETLWHATSEYDAQTCNLRASSFKVNLEHSGVTSTPIHAREFHASHAESTTVTYPKSSPPPPLEWPSRQIPRSAIIPGL